MDFPQQTPSASTSTNTAAAAATATTTTESHSAGSSTPGKRKFGFSEIANLFIRMRRHRSRSSLASQARRESGAPTETTSPQPEATSPPPFLATSPIATHHASTETQPHKVVVLTPPSSPSRNRFRRLTGSPYSRPRPTSSSGSKPKAHHLVSSSGEEPITHSGIWNSRIEGAITLPVEYTDRFECIGGVNTPTLLRATRRSILEAVEGLGANALADEKWECIICGPKHGSYKVQVNYSATATRCTRLDGFCPVALDHAEGFPGLMTITKRNDSEF